MGRRCATSWRNPCQSGSETIIQDLSSSVTLPTLLPPPITSSIHFQAKRKTITAPSAGQSIILDSTVFYGSGYCSTFCRWIFWTLKGKPFISTLTAGFIGIRHNHNPLLLWQNLRHNPLPLSQNLHHNPLLWWNLRCNPLLLWWNLHCNQLHLSKNLLLLLLRILHHNQLLLLNLNLPLAPL